MQETILCAFVSEIRVFAQCPCGGPGINPLVLLAIVAGIWLLAKWVKSILRKEGVSLMNKIGKIVIVIVLIVAVVVVIAIKQNRSSQGTTETIDAVSGGKTIPQQTRIENSSDQPLSKALPVLIDLGAGKCIPCKMMAPILEELKREYTGRLKVEFIDVWKKPNEAKKYKIRIIPTQIFYDASGKELFRHEGFYSKEDILGKWKEFGINLEKGTNNETN
jgi:thioredoxin 1